MLTSSASCVYQYLEYCDNVLVLEDGEVQEAGDHKALMKANNRYAQLISTYQMELSKVRQNHIGHYALTCVVLYSSSKCFSPAEKQNGISRKTRDSSPHNYHIGRGGGGTYRSAGVQVHGFIISCTESSFC